MKILTISAISLFTISSQAAMLDCDDVYVNEMQANLSKASVILLYSSVGYADPDLFDLTEPVSTAQHISEDLGVKHAPKVRSLKIEIPRKDCELDTIPLAFSCDSSNAEVRVARAGHRDVEFPLDELSFDSDPTGENHMVKATNLTFRVDAEKGKFRAKHKLGFRVKHHSDGHYLCGVRVTKR